MPRFFVTDESVRRGDIEGEILLSGEDFFHVSKVLRYKPGDKIIFCDKESRDYSCTITEIRDASLTARIDGIADNDSEPSLQVTLFQAVPKSDKMEQVIQKAVELGVTKIVPVLTKRCVSRPKDEGKKADRWNKIALSAAKQCGRGIIPTVEKITPFKEIPDRMQESALFAVFYENEDHYPFSSFCQKLKGAPSFSFLVGPEGGLDREEIAYLANAGIPSVSLGKRILRTETVAGCVLSISMFETGNL